MLPGIVTVREQLMFILVSLNPKSLGARETRHFYHTFILQKSGLSAEIGEAFKSFKDFDPLVLVLILSIITAAFTEIASNTASATIFIPILAELVCAFSYSVVLNSSAILREYRLPLSVLNLIYPGHRLLYSK